MTSLLPDRTRRVRAAEVETDRHEPGDAPASPRDVARDGFVVWGHRFRWWTWLAVLVAGFLALVARRVDVLTDPKLWGEDGPVLLADAYLKGWPSSLFRPYAGYLILVPKIWAELVSLASASLLALAYALFALVAATTSYALVLMRRLRWLIPSDGMRLLLFFVLILLPGSLEAFGSSILTVWTLGVALIVLGLANQPTSRAGRLGEGVSVILLGLTGFASLLVWPAFWLRWLREKTKHNAVVASLVTGCALTQAVVLVTAQRAGAHGGLKFNHLDTALQVLVLRVGGTLALGEKRIVAELSSPPVPAGVWVVSIGVLVLAAVSLHVMPPRGRLPLLLTFLMIYGSTFWDRGGDMAIFLLPPANGNRYFFLPVVVVAVVLAAGMPRLMSSHRPIGIVAVVLCALALGFGITQDAAMRPYPTTEWKKSAACIAAHRACHVPVNPPGWGVDLPPIPGAH